MATISVIHTIETENGWSLVVDVGGREHTVHLSDTYYRKLSGGQIEPEDLVKISFEFLLERESAESIMDEFELPLIRSFFPEYEEEVIQRIQIRESK